MAFPHKPTRRVLPIALLWAAGIAAIYWLTPEGPREGWQPPKGENCCGFLKDGKTLVTVTVDSSKPSYSEIGPIRLWDIDTGTLRASHFGPEDSFEGVLVDRELDLVRIGQHGGGPKRSFQSQFGPWEPEEFDLRLHDAVSGKEVARFHCAVPQAWPSWVFSDNGETTAFATWDQEGKNTTVVVHDVRSGRLLRKFPDCSDAMILSPDGRRLAVCRGQKIIVFDVLTGQELAGFPMDGTTLQPTGPKTFSPDGKLLLDNECAVWDVDADIYRFRVLGVASQSSVFSPDGKWLIVVKPGMAVDSLVYYDTVTGKEATARRKQLPTQNVGMTLNPALPDGSWIVTSRKARVTRSNTQTQLLAWLSKIPYPGRTTVIQRLSKEQWQDHFVLFEAATGREISRGNLYTWTCTPDGRFILGANPESVLELWDNPPRKPVRQLVTFMLAWSAMLALLVTFIAGIKRSSNREVQTDSELRREES